MFSFRIVAKGPLLFVWSRAYDSSRLIAMRLPNGEMVTR